MNAKNLGVLALLAVLVGGVVLISGCSNTGDQNHAPLTPRAETWEMENVWNISTFGIPFMDMSPNGSLSAVIDDSCCRVYLAKPDGRSTSFDLQGYDAATHDKAVEPVIAGVAIKGGCVYVLGDYYDDGAWSGLKIYSWNGGEGRKKIGSFPDDIMRSPDGKYMCYLISLSPTEQSLTCEGYDGDGVEMRFTSNAYNIHSVSDTGVVIVTRDDKSFVIKGGKTLLTVNSPSVIAYRDKLIVSENGTLKILSLEGSVLATKENAGFDQTTLLRWTLLPTGKYLFRHEALEDTHVLTWNLSEVKVLPGFPYFANEDFIVTAKDGIIHCYSLADFHEVFNVKVPEDSLGYIKLSDDGKIMLISGEWGNFYLYRAVRR